MALQLAGLDLNPETVAVDDLEAATAKLGKAAVPALFWSASCLGKWIDLNRDDIASAASLASAATLMKRVLELDDSYYYGGPHLFFGVYYGGLAPMFGGNFALAEEHFRRADEINQGKLLMVELLQAEYLYRQQLNRTAFHDKLQYILDAPQGLYPEMALVNAICKQRAVYLLALEDGSDARTISVAAETVRGSAALRPAAGVHRSIRRTCLPVKIRDPRTIRHNLGESAGRMGQAGQAGK